MGRVYGNATHSEYEESDTTEPPSSVPNGAVASAQESKEHSPVDSTGWVWQEDDGEVLDEESMREALLVDNPIVHRLHHGRHQTDISGLVVTGVSETGNPIEDFELLDDLDGVSMAGMPREGLSVGRIADGVDTDISEDDFTANMPPTPGEPNEEAGGAGGGGDSPGGGCGCGKGGPGGGDAPAGEASAVAGVVATLAIFVAMRRREEEPMENL